MTIACDGPDTDLGVALRMSSYLDCQARALGENGFQALIGGPVATGLLSGLVTIFVALIGYRLLLGGLPSVRDGVTWMVRLGLVLALVTGWPAYQTLVFSVAVDAPGQLSALIIPAAGLPGEGIETRVQQVYDTIRLGVVTDVGAGLPPQSAEPQQPERATPQPLQPGGPSVQGALPQTASVFAMSTVGVIASLRIAIGFLLAVGPLAILSLLFDATLGLFSGWVRALAGTALATAAATMVTAIDLVMVESELARLQSYSAGGIAMAVDPQAITTLVMTFALVMLITTLAAMKMAGAFRMPTIGRPVTDNGRGRSNHREIERIDARGRVTPIQSRGNEGMMPVRVAAVTDALAATVRREQAGSVSSTDSLSSRHHAMLPVTSNQRALMTLVPLGVAGRRAIGRRSGSAARRDSAGL